MINREQIYAALFDKFASAAEFKTKSRRIKHITDMTKPDLPALFMLQRAEVPIQEKKVPIKWQLGVDFYVYVDTGADKNTVPASIINPILDKIELLLKPNPVLGYATLNINGVSHAWISNIDIFAGELDEKGIAIISVEVLAVS